MNIMQIMDGIPRETKLEIIELMKSLKGLPFDEFKKRLVLFEIGHRLKELRGEKTLEEVAEAVCITKNSLIAYEAGKRMPRDEVKINLSAYYGVSIDTLFNVSFDLKAE